MLVVNYTISQSNTNQSAEQIYNQFQRQIPWLNLLLRQMNIPRNVIDSILIGVIQITLDEIRNGGDQPGRCWIGWDDLGGILTSAPAITSWQLNRLDVFVRGTDNSLHHKWWDGSRWSDWENLGGTLTGGRAVSSRCSNQLDVL